MNNEKNLDISWETILKIFFAAFAFYVVYQIRNIIIWFVFALIISILLNPLIDFLKKSKIPRIIAATIVYIGFLAILILLIYPIAPVFANEAVQFSQILPQYFEKVSPFLGKLGIRAFESVEAFVDVFEKSIEKITGNVFSAITAFFGGVFTTIFILTTAFFISLEEKWMEKIISIFSSPERENQILNIWKRCQKKVSGWFFTRVLACLFVGILSLVVFFLFGSPYPLSLALIAGVLNFVPIVGPVITALILLIIISLESAYKAVFVLVAFTLIQQIENNILTPFLSKKIIGLSPVLVLMSLAIGGTLLGFLGAVFAIPLAVILFEFLKEFLQKRKEEKLAEQDL